jgi:hypothetical protein
MEMDKQKLTQLFSEALEKKCTFSLHFSQYQNIPDSERRSVTKDEAFELVSRFAEAIGITNIRNNEYQPHADDYTIDNMKFRVVCTYIPNKEEKSNAKQRKIEALEKELAELKKVEEVSA